MNLFTKSGDQREQVPATVREYRSGSRPCRPMRPHIVFSGGGTGGHLFPGLAVARHLADTRPEVRITFAGGGKPLERAQVAAAEFDYLALRCHPRPRGIVDAWRFVADNLAGYRTARRFLAEMGVDAVVGLGGYASVPMARAAARQGVPLVLLEQNAVPGRATRWLARRATLVCTAFQAARRHLPCGCSVRLTGNPVRWPIAPGLSLGGNPKSDSRHRPRLVVLGGSGGSGPLNQVVPEALGRLVSRLGGWRILHQAGRGDFEAIRLRYARFGLKAEVVGFLPDMPQVLADADLAVCRAGGTTLAELAVAGVSAVVVPFSQAADDHQRRNAEAFAAEGACLLVDERPGAEPFAQRLATAVCGLLAGPARRAAMSRAMRRLGRPQAAAEVAEVVLPWLVGGEAGSRVRSAA